MILNGWMKNLKRVKMTIRTSYLTGHIRFIVILFSLTLGYALNETKAVITIIGGDHSTKIYQKAFGLSPDAAG